MKLPDGPRANIEIKARLADPAAAERVARALGARDAGTDRQTDTYFRVPRGRLKLRRSSLSGDQLVVYLRPDSAGPRRADYEVIPVRPDGRTEELLAAILGVDAVVAKSRRLFLLGNTRIHLDRVDGLGTFLELEAVYARNDADAERAARDSVDRLLSALGVLSEDLVARSYRELVLESASDRGASPVC